MKFTPVQLDAPAGTSAARSGVLSIITIGLQGGTRFISNWLIGRIAGKVALGAVASATALALTLHTLWTSSAPAAASKFIGRARGKKDSVELFAVTHHLAKRVIQVSLLLSAVAPVVWVLLYNGAVWEGLCISLILITVATSQFARGVHFGAGQVARGTRFDVVTSIVGITATGIMLALGVRNLSLTLPLSLAMAIYSLACWPWAATGRPEKALRSEIDKFVIFGALGSIASAGMLQISQLNAAALGDHAAQTNAPALQLVTPLSIIASALTMVLYPKMAEAQGAGDKQRLNRQTDLATRAFIAVLVPCFGAVAIASRPVIALVWGKSFAESAVLMPVYALALLIYNVSAPSVSSITSGEHKKMWYSLIASQVGFASAVVFWLVFTTRLGVFGVALGYAVGATVTSVSLIIIAWRLGRQRWLGLTSTLVAGMAVVAGLSWWRLTSPLNYLIDCLVAAGFALVWMALWSPVLLRVLRARRQPQA